MAEETSLTIIGNAVTDVDLRFTPSGAAVANFRIASTPRIFDKQTNAWKDGESLFLTVTAWRQLAENLAESVSKGTRLIVHGTLKMRSYEKDGEKKTVYEIDAAEVGPSLKFATAKVQKMQRSGGNSGRPAPSAEADPWVTAAPSGGQQGFDVDQPPF